VVRWSDRLPENFVGVILANEVLDALPCERFVQGPAGLLARGVGVSSTGELTEVLRDPRLTKDLHLPAAETLHAVYAAMADRLRSSVCDLPLGYAGEFIPSMTPFVQSLSAALTRGAVVLVDYGLPRRQLYLPERSAGSLRCIRRHHAHEDAFRDAGLTDITSWVDFTHLAEAAGQSGLELRAFATQMAWMLDAGIERLLADQLAVGLSATQHQNLVQGVKTLLLPGEMGEAVKMLCLVRDLARGLGVVATQDLTASL
jgi:SAM-dependent MidA family methyltransferase